MEQHPRIAKYAMENHNLREENKRLRSLQSVKKAQEIDAQTVAELEKAFLEASATERNTGGKTKLTQKLNTINYFCGVQQCWKCCLSSCGFVLYKVVPEDLLCKCRNREFGFLCIL